jgi:hypothetical protein
MKKFMILIISLLIIPSWVTSSHALLFSRLGGEAVYDDDLNITWLSDTNYAQSSGFDTDGLMNWTAANNWAEGITVAGVSEWRLPKVSTPCEGTACTGSEMAHLLHVELNGTGHTSDPNLALFSNLQNNWWWTSTLANSSHSTAFQYGFYNGHLTSRSITQEHFAWAVHDGDVFSSHAPVPEPGTLILMGSGLVGIFPFRKKFRKKA